MMMTRHEKERKETVTVYRSSRRRVVVVCALGVLLASWCGAIVLTHLTQNVVTAVHQMDPGLELRKTDDLVDRVGSGKGYPWYTIYKGDQFKGDVYLFTFDNAASRRLYLLALFVPRQITWAVYFDDAQTVQRVWSLSPRFPTGLDARYSKLLDSLKGVACRDLVSAREPILPAEGGDLTVSARLAIGNLAISVYASRNSTADLNQLIMEDRSAGLAKHESFPLFSATTTAGQRIDTTTLRGHNTLFMTAQPSCGFCFDAVVQSVERARALNGDPWNIVLVLFAEADGEGSQALMAAAGSSVGVILDPDRKLGNQVFMPDSPCMTVLDKTATVLYKGSGDKLPDLFTAIDIVQSGGTLPE
jgi:hypothetical protein